MRGKIIQGAWRKTYVPNLKNDATRSRARGSSKKGISGVRKGLGGKATRAVGDFGKERKEIIQGTQRKPVCTGEENGKIR